MKTIKKIIKIICSILLLALIVFFTIGYFTTRSDFKNPPEHYTRIGQRIYTAVPAMMIDSTYDSLNLGGCGIKIGVLDAGFGGMRQRPWTKNLQIAAYANFVSGDTVSFRFDTPPCRIL